ncbi:MAG: Uncharacterized conserved protein YdhG, YjbR/CyaY-like superfamily, DUF1801 family [Candidatus Nitrotoga sp. MKT]|nr:MAG: Uncharacterized conserved protein YdhG, YjbR/CyaY-like superfamily, DUF1801 family [Candidatus Nitrotoga sp. MKT]
MPHQTHEEYFASVTPEARVLLERIQAEVQAIVPDATKCMGYQMPAFRQKKVFFYFAAFKKHIGVYPPVTNDKAFVLELARYRGPKGNLSFPLNEPLPIDLIRKVAAALSTQYS